MHTIWRKLNPKVIGPTYFFFSEMLFFLLFCFSQLFLNMRKKTLWNDSSTFSICWQNLEAIRLTWPLASCLSLKYLFNLSHIPTWSHFSPEIFLKTLTLKINKTFHLILLSLCFFVFVFVLLCCFFLLSSRALCLYVAIHMNLIHKSL